MAIDHESWLAQLLADVGAVAGSAHVVEDDCLILRAAVNLPEPVLRATGRIPQGKGMAGLAWERKQPVTTCNLQAPSADVRPGAAAVGAGAAAALPVFDQAGDVRAVVGVAFADQRELQTDELSRLAASVASLP